MAVEHRHAKVKIYRKTEKYRFYRIAFRAEVKRVVRNFKTWSAAKKEADRIVRQIAKDNEAAAALSVKDALAYRFARTKRAELNADSLSPHK